MQLQFITTQKCPKCGAGVSSESVEWGRNYNSGLSIRTHAHGGSWETRRFACGYGVEYIPNYSGERPLGECTQSPEYASKVKKRNAAMESIKGAIAASDCDDKFKEEVWSRIEYMIHRER